MRNQTEDAGSASGQSPLVVWGATDFQLRVLEKLGALEAKVDMIVGNGQPGRMKLVEDRLRGLERNDLRRSVYDRVIAAAISFAISAAIAWRDHLGLR